MPATSSLLSLIDGDTSRGLDIILASGVHPAVLKIHNNIQHAQLVHQVCGDDTLIIMRQSATEHFIDYGLTNGLPPDVIAQQWFNATEPFMQCAPWAYFEIGGPGFSAGEDNAAATRYTNVILAAMRLMAAQGYKGVGLTFYEGTPRTKSDGFDGWAPYWPVVTLAAELGFLLGMQGYWVDANMSLDDDWHCFRILRVLRDYPDKFPPGTRIVLTEYGIDLRNGQGWKAALGNDATRYCAGLFAGDAKWRAAKLPTGVQVVGQTAFILQEWGSMWDDFNLWEVLPQMLEYIRSQVYVPPAPEPDPDPPPTPDPPVVNLLQNPSREGGSRKESANLDIPKLWNVWQGTGSGDIHSELDSDPYFVIDGVWAGRLWQSWSARGMAYMQSVPATVGAEYTYTDNSFAWSTNHAEKYTPSQADIPTAVGIDPFGGVDPMASSVVWSTMSTVRDAYVEHVVSAVAKSAVITVFAFSAPMQVMSRNDVRWDKASLIISKPPPAPTVIKIARVTSPDGVNQRAEPKMASTKLGMISSKETPKTYLTVETPPVNGYVKVVGQPYWVLAANCTFEDIKEN